MPSERSTAEGPDRERESERARERESGRLGGGGMQATVGQRTRMEADQVASSGHGLNLAR